MTIEESSAAAGPAGDAEGTAQRERPRAMRPQHATEKTVQDDQKSHATLVRPVWLTPPARLDWQRRLRLALRAPGQPTGGLRLSKPGFGIGLSLLRAGFAWASLCALLPGAADSRETDWIRVQTRHFTVFSNASNKKTIQLALNLEKLREVLLRMGATQNLGSRRPTFVYVFKDNFSFRLYGQWVNTSPAAVPGFCVTHSEGNFLAIDASSRHEPTRVLYHEYLHAFLEGLDTRLPLWFREGVAEYYSTFEVDGKEARIGKPLQHHVDWLRDNGMMPLDRLFATTRRSRLYNEMSKRGWFYAQSWATVHYLLTGNAERREQTSRFLELVSEGVQTDVAFQQAFPVDATGLLKEVWTYLQQPQIGYTELSVGELHVQAKAYAVPLRFDEAAYRLGDLLAHITPLSYREAEKHFRVSLQANPRHAGALAGLGWVAEIDRNEAEARQYYEEALAQDPNDARTLVRFGNLLLEPLTREEPWRVEADPESAALLQRARESFQKGITVNPEHAEARAAWGSTYLFETLPPVDALSALLTAFSLQPSRTDIACDLVALYSKRGDRREAERWLGELRRLQATPAMLAKAKDALLLADAAEALALASDGHVKDGVERLDATLRAAADPAFRTELQNLRNRLARSGVTVQTD